MAQVTLAPQADSRSQQIGKQINVLRYQLIIDWSDEDEAFLVEVPELPGCMADGETYAEAVAQVQHIIREWIETAHEIGRPVPLPRSWN